MTDALRARMKKIDSPPTEAAARVLYKLHAEEEHDHFSLGDHEKVLEALDGEETDSVRAQEDEIRLMIVWTALRRILHQRADSKFHVTART